MKRSTKSAALGHHSTAQGQRLLVIAVLALLALGAAVLLFLAVTALGGPHAVGLQTIHPYPPDPPIIKG